MNKALARDYIDVNDKCLLLALMPDKRITIRGINELERDINAEYNLDTNRIIGQGSKIWINDIKEAIKQFKEKYNNLLL